MARSFVIKLVNSAHFIDLVVWCNSTIGIEARITSELSDRYPWYADPYMSGFEFKFYRDEDAIQFALRWL